MLKQILLSDNPAELIRQNKDKIFDIIPELKICDGFLQHNDYHIYDVFEHILHVLEEVDNDYVLRISALFHDIGKPNCFKLDEKGIGHFYGHWNESFKIFSKYKDLFELTEEEIELINNLIYYHDLELNMESIDTFRDVFKDKMSLLISLKKADILSQNPKYYYRLDELEKIE